MAACARHEPRASMLESQQLRPAQLRLGIYGPQPEIPVWEEIVQNFEAKWSQIKVEIEHVASNYQEKLLALAAADQIWDVMRATDEPFYANCDKGAFRDITAYWTRDQKEIDPSDFVEGQVDFWRWDPERKIGGTKSGKLMGTPRDGGMQLFIYNKRAFDEAGIAYPPRNGNWTWDDFLNICKRLTQLDSAGRFIRAGFRLPTNWTHAMNWLAPKGIELLDTVNKVSTISRPEAVAGLKQILDYRFVHRVASRDVDFPGVPARDQLARGQIAMLIENPVFAALRESFKDDPANWEVAHMPMDPITRKRAARTSWGGLANGRSSRFPDQSWELMKYIISAEGQRLWARLGRSMPCRLSVLRSDAWNRPDTPQDESIWVEALQYQKYQPITELWNETDRIWSFYWRQMTDDSIRRDPREAAQRIDEAINYLFKTGRMPELS